MGPETHRYLTDNNALLCCPRCQGALVLGHDDITCSSCQQDFQISGDIPLLYWPNEWDASKADVTSVVKAFYEETPFPNYDEFDSIGSLIVKARRGVFARLLDEQIPFGTGVLECGCGTGQLSNFLSIANRTVFGTDICLNSLRLGHDFKVRNNLGSVHFLQMNIFRPIFKAETFDLVICNGVLHHTADPFLGFRNIAQLVRPRGYFLVGLYHKCGRLITNTRRFIFRLFGDRFTFLDPNLRGVPVRDAKREAWFMDQYKHPHESRHTIGEVLGWLGQTGFSLVRTIPKTTPFKPFSESEQLFVPERPGTPLDRVLVELGMVFTGSREGGFFVVIARKE